MKFENEQIKDFLLLTETFDVMRLGQVMDLGILGVSEEEELELNKRFQKVCIEFFAIDLLLDDDREFIFQMIAASMRAEYNDDFEAKFYESLQEGGFFQFAIEFDPEAKRNRLEEIQLKALSLFADDLDDEDDLDFSSIFDDEEEKKERVEKSYHDNGQLAKEMPYNDENQLQGEARTYYENGNVCQIVPYVHDNIDGVVYEYNKSGFLEKESVYENNQAHGSQKGYYEDGSLEYETIYQYDNAIDGIQYYPNGNVKATVEYDENGERHGWLKKYYEDGSLEQEVEFLHGKPKLETVKEYNEDGSIKPTRIRVGE